MKDRTLQRILTRCRIRIAKNTPGGQQRWRRKKPGSVG